jgi:hypothetical protein
VSVQNQSGASIDVRELGLMSNVSFNSSNYQMLFDRKLVNEGVVTIADQQYATFSWEICYNLI